MTQAVTIVLIMKDEYSSFEQTFSDLKEAFDKYNELIAMKRGKVHWLQLDYDIETVIQFRNNRLKRGLK